MPTLDEPSATPSNAPRGMHRRSVVRAGAAAAWSVPLIQLAAAAPASAVVSGGLLISMTVSRQLTQTTLTTLTGIVTNNSAQPTANLLVTVTITPVAGGNFNGSTTTNPGTWTQIASATVAGAIQFSFNRAPQLAAGEVDPGFTPVFTLKHAHAGSFTAVATSDNQAQGTTSGSFS